jgi:glycogen(starch) synthase
MRIALFASAFHPHVGGVEELVRQLAHAYRESGDEAIVITNRWPPSLPAREEFEGIPVYRVPMRVPEGTLRVRVKYTLTHSGISREVLGALRRHRTELLHVQCVSSNGYYALEARRALALPLVVTTQGERTMDAERIYQKSPLINGVLQQLLTAADFVTACSRNTLDDVREFHAQRGGAAFDDRSRVVYNGIRLADFEGAEAFEHSRPYILGIGRLVPQKGFDVLLRAFAQARLQEHDLLLAGEGAQREPLEVLARELGVGDRVRFVGRADRPTAVALFRGCSFFVLPSRHEPQGIVNLEAMAVGKAVVASRVGGVPEIVLDGQTGVLVPGEDVDALAGALRAMEADPARREQLGRAGKERAQSFDWTAIAAQYRDIYHAACARSKASAPA